MFERFTESARQVTIGSQEHARRRDDRRIGVEHFLMSACDSSDSSRTAVADALAGHGITLATIESSLDESPPETGGVDADRDALSILGVDVDAVQDAMDEAFGVGALDRARSANERERFGARRTSGRAAATKYIAFSSEAKMCLEGSLRVALSRKDKFICDAHVVLSATRVEDGPAWDLFADQDVDLDALRRELADCITGD